MNRLIYPQIFIGICILESLIVTILLTVISIYVVETTHNINNLVSHINPKNIEYDFDRISDIVSQINTTTINDFMNDLNITELQSEMTTITNSIRNMTVLANKVYYHIFNQ